MVIPTTTAIEKIETPRFEMASSSGEPRVCYRVSLERGVDGWIIAKCLDIEGAISQGKTVDQALKNIVEAISAILEARGEGQREFLITWVEK